MSTKRAHREQARCISRVHIAYLGNDGQMINKLAVGIWRKGHDTLCCQARRHPTELCTVSLRVEQGLVNDRAASGHCSETPTPNFMPIPLPASDTPVH